jgi:hypothetical protein
MGKTNERKEARDVLTLSAIEEKESIWTRLIDRIWKRERTVYAGFSLHSGLVGVLLGQSILFTSISEPSYPKIKREKDFCVRS